jgi:toxin-antitoxin system PIN domain toxin
MAALLDVNLLLALAWPDHVHHQIANTWFSVYRSHGWATCLLTQLGFLRLSIQPNVVKSVGTMTDAQSILNANLASEDHEFWPLDYPFAEILPEIRQHIVGHKQLTDALLLDLAIRNNGRLATFDRRIRSLLNPQSPHQASIELLPFE